jgi:LmbE family N-acetylglucosaminyl deacetylase
MHLFLSPHLDDVVLSCGATIARLRKQGEDVLILTAMAGEPPDDLPDTPLVHALRTKLDGVNKAVVTRRQEDAQAALCLGVRIYHLSLLESAYRTARTPEGVLPLYPSDESQYGDPHPADDTRINLHMLPLPFRDKVTALYAPLGVGNHVDHQLVRDWALVLGGAHAPQMLKFYGEYPYALNPGALAQALHYYERALPGLKLSVEVVPADSDEVETKMTALRCYATKAALDWQTFAEMDHAVREWMLATGSGQPAERFWRVVKQTGMLG